MAPARLARTSTPRRTSTVRRGTLFAGSLPAIAFVPSIRRPTNAQTGLLRSCHSGMTGAMTQRRAGQSEA